MKTSFCLNEELFNSMYAKWHMELTLLAYKQGISIEDAEDIASDVLLKYWEKGEEIYPKNLLRNNLLKQVQDHQKNRKRRVGAETIFLQLRLGELSFGRRYRFEEREEILRMAKQLSGPEQILLYSSLIEELDLPQIAERLQKAVTTIANLYQYTIFNLKKILEKKRANLYSAMNQPSR